jgi:amidase
LLLNITIEKASEGLELGRFTSADLVKAYLARIEEASGFNAVLQVNPDALAVAKHLDDERVRSGSRGFVMYSTSSYKLLTIIALYMAFPF